MSYLDIETKKISPIVDELNTLLADYHVYYQNLRGFHWNVLGKNFFDLHEKFEELYTDARIKIDEIAERILTLRHHLMGGYIAALEKVSWMLDAWTKDTRDQF